MRGRDHPIFFPSDEIPPLAGHIKKVLSKEKCRHVGGHTPGGRRSPSSSGDETTDVDSPNEGYTSGDFNTDDEPGSLSFCLEKETEGCESLTATSAQPHTITGNSAARRDTSMSPGNNYSIGDYAPLSSLVPKPGKGTQQKSPQRKRRKIMGKPGKTMKEAYFKGILWTRYSSQDPLTLRITSLNSIVGFARVTCQFTLKVPGKSYVITRLSPT